MAPHAPSPGVAVTPIARSILFPVDATKLRLREGATMTMEMEATGTQNGRTLEMSIRKHTTREGKFRLR